MSNQTTRGMMQSKREAWWFYRFLSMVYDGIVNPWHWTPEMREQALSDARLDRENLVVIDVGGGTGFCTEGLVKRGIQPDRIVLVDQSVHQLRKAQAKPALARVQLIEADAEDLPAASDSFDRYVSAGSIEYWPEPARGIAEAYRVLKPGGYATVIGPERATHWLSRRMGDLWMLFPEESDYQRWFKEAGFEQIEVNRIIPDHFGGVRKHGLIMGLVVTGRKERSSEGSTQVSRPAESRHARSPAGSFLIRWTLGAVAGFYYFVMGIALAARTALGGKGRGNQ